MSLIDRLDLRAHLNLVLLVGKALLLLSLGSVGSSHLCSPLFEVRIE